MCFSLVSAVAGTPRFTNAPNIASSKKRQVDFLVVTVRGCLNSKTSEFSLFEESIEPWYSSVCGSRQILGFLAPRRLFAPSRRLRPDNHSIRVTNVVLDHNRQEVFLTQQLSKCIRIFFLLHRIYLQNETGRVPTKAWHREMGSPDLRSYWTVYQLLPVDAVTCRPVLIIPGPSQMRSYLGTQKLKVTTLLREKRAVGGPIRAARNVLSGGLAIGYWLRFSGTRSNCLGIEIHDCACQPE